MDNEVDALESNGTVVSPEITAVKVSTKENELGKAFSQQTERSEQSDKGFNSNRRNDIFSAKANFISLIEDVGGECLFLATFCFLFDTLLSCSFDFQDLSLYLQDPATRPCPDPVESSPHLPPTFL